MLMLDNMNLVLMSSDNMVKELLLEMEEMMGLDDHSLKMEDSQEDQVDQDREDKEDHLDDTLHQHEALPLYDIVDLDISYKSLVVEDMEVCLLDICVFQPCLLDICILIHL